MFHKDCKFAISTPKALEEKWVYYPHLHIKIN